MVLISQYLPGGTEENNERIQSKYAVSRPKFESTTSKIEDQIFAPIQHGVRHAYRDGGLHAVLKNLKCDQQTTKRRPTELDD
jgi:hypothetical protein